MVFLDTLPYGLIVKGRATIGDVALSIEDELGAAEGAIRTRQLVPHRDMRGDLTIDQPLEQPDCAMHSVSIMRGTLLVPPNFGGDDC